MNKSRYQAEYDSIPQDVKDSLAWWIKTFIRRVANTNHNQQSYGMKTAFEMASCKYVSNEQFKAAMLNAGYTPVNPKGANWVFKIYRADNPLEFGGFYEWCVLHSSGLTNPARDFVKDLRADDDFPRIATKKSVVLDYLEGVGACSEAIDGFNVVWKRYIAGQKRKRG